MICSFVVCVAGQRFIPFAIFALLVEINSLFLHTRRLMRMRGVDPNGVTFRTNRIFLIVTFVIFRLIVCGWLGLCMLVDRHELGPFPFAVGFGGMCISMAQNVVMLNQLRTSDAKRIKQPRPAEKETGSPRWDYNANSSLGGLKQFLQMTNACNAADWLEIVVCWTLMCITAA